MPGPNKDMNDIVGRDFSIASVSEAIQCGKHKNGLLYPSMGFLAMAERIISYGAGSPDVGALDTLFLVSISSMPISVCNSFIAF